MTPWFLRSKYQIQTYDIHRDTQNKRPALKLAHLLLCTYAVMTALENARKIRNVQITACQIDTFPDLSLNGFTELAISTV